MLKKINCDSYSDFLEIASQFGNISKYSDIRNESKNSDMSIKSYSSIYYHNDMFNEGIIGWYCENPGENEPTFLINISDFNQYFTEKEKNKFEKIKLTCPKGIDRPMLRKNSNNDNLLYFLPWRIQDINSDEEKLLRSFKKYIDNKDKNERTDVHLKKGEALFVDDKKFLHARPELDKNTKRFLRRVWINKEKT